MNWKIILKEKWIQTIMKFDWLIKFYLFIKFIKFGFIFIFIFILIFSFTMMTTTMTTMTITTFFFSILIAISLNVFHLIKFFFVLSTLFSWNAAVFALFQLQRLLDKLFFSLKIVFFAFFQSRSKRRQWFNFVYFADVSEKAYYYCLHSYLFELNKINDEKKWK